MKNENGWMSLNPLMAHQSFITDLDYFNISHNILHSRISPEYSSEVDVVDSQTGVDCILPDTVFTRSLKDAIEKRAQEILGDVYLASIWCAVLEHGQSVPYHSHRSNAHLFPTEYWSGVIYIDAGTGGCRLCLYSGDSTGHQHVTKIQPENGKIVFFNSFVPHQTERYYGDKPRICVSFDLRPNNPTTNTYPDMKIFAP